VLLRRKGDRKGVWLGFYTWWIQRYGILIKLGYLVDEIAALRSLLRRARAMTPNPEGFCINGFRQAETTLKKESLRAALPLATTAKQSR